MNYSWERRSVDVETQTRVGYCVFRVADDNQPVIISYTMRDAPGGRGEPLGLGEAERMFLGHQLPLFPLESAAAPAAPSPPSTNFLFLFALPRFPAAVLPRLHCFKLLYCIGGGGGGLNYPQ